MADVWLSCRAGAALVEYLTLRGHWVHLISAFPGLDPAVASHADLRMCKMGPSGPVLHSGSDPSPGYPGEAAMCALVLERVLIHRLDITDKRILQYCRERRFREIHVRQGYTRCSCVPVDGSSLITADPGILLALAGVPEIDVLKVRPGCVSLPGYAQGFLGGCAGRVGDEILFNGDLSRHPDYTKIRNFIEFRGLGVRFFPGYALSDIGSIIEE